MIVGYSRKIRVRKRGDFYILEELTPSSSGRYFIKRRRVSLARTLKEAVRDSEEMPALVFPAGPSGPTPE